MKITRVVNPAYIFDFSIEYYFEYLFVDLFESNYIYITRVTT